ncbi:hypothetical protein F383_28589 [Gossypium arboreum]|uniref:Uncharacterized protein n=1 Tax=Gossypium arboreum TaxID=29729 RepID=A0A0B0PD66_GOSAR|nr:hypothetical protein F383_28589 [Gossypium arboreum]
MVLLAHTNWNHISMPTY